ncbi:MAG: hypothetical protein AAGA18_14755 [Verrucomicrobiota bacterium]
MSASNYNWVCFDCKFVTRQAKHSKLFPQCTFCGKDCYCLGYKVEVPKKTNEKAWKELRDECSRRNLEYIEAKNKNTVTRKHQLEQEICRLSGLGKNVDRMRLIAKLRKELELYS